MIRKDVQRFSEEIMPKQDMTAKTGAACLSSCSGIG
jgi:hypothetical protein